MRQQRIRAIHNMFKGTGKAQLSKVLAICSYNLGLSRKTSRQYLQVLEDLGFIEIDDEADLISEITLEPAGAR